MKKIILLLFFLLCLFIVSALPHADYPQFSQGESRFVLADDLFVVSDDLVYHRAYYSVAGGDWQPVSLTGAAHKGSSRWLSGSSSASLPSFGVGEHYVIAYSCSRGSSSWDCHDGRWQLHVIDNAVTNPCDGIVCNDSDECIVDVCVAGACEYQAIPNCAVSEETMFSCKEVDANKFNVLWCEDYERFPIGPRSAEQFRADYDIALGGVWFFGGIDQDLGEVNPSKYIRLDYPKNTRSWDGGANVWHDIGGPYEDVYLSYNIRLKPQFWWVKGGKLHGLAGLPYCNGVGSPRGYDEETGIGYGCGPTEGFINIIMWHNDGHFVSYGSHHDQETEISTTFNWNSYLDTGKWHTITFHVKMNDPEVRNGLLEGYINGVLVYRKTDMNWRERNGIGVDVFRMSSFFGGSTDDWITVRDEWTNLDNVVVFTYKQPSQRPDFGERIELPNLLVTPDNPAPDTQIVVRAKGTPTLGEYSKFKVLVNNDYIGGSYTTSDFQDYVFYTDFLPEDIDFVTVHHYDTSLEGSEENGWMSFTLSEISVDGVEYSVFDERVVFDRGSLDMRNTIPSNSDTTVWLGSWIFFFDDALRAQLTDQKQVD